MCFCFPCRGKLVVCFMSVFARTCTRAGGGTGKMYRQAGTCVGTSQHLPGAARLCFSTRGCGVAGPGVFGTSAGYLLVMGETVKAGNQVVCFCPGR